MNENQENLLGVVMSTLYNQSNKSASELRELIQKLAPIVGPDMDNEDLEQVARKVEASLGISAGLCSIVDNKDFLPWLEDAKKDIDPYFWRRYRDYLTRNGMPKDVVVSMDTVTEKILSRLGNPKLENAWDRRGMVVGHVQSGKTSNYIGLMCKAADAGYRLIIVVAGLHNNLRNQTQGRIDLGFIGRDTGKLLKRNSAGDKNLIGVGLIDSEFTPVSLTNVIRDFNKETATTNTSGITSYNVPLVLVIKKNKNSLTNLNEWLSANSVRGNNEMIEHPMLLIDDEADNASINTKYSKKDITTINGLIRDLLNKFHRSCYVGYTATPFANIFIDPDQEDEMYKEDLFPRHFIIGLDPPSNYFGPTKVFGENLVEDGESKWLRYITDNEDVLPISHKIDHQLEGLPESLVEALRTFLLTRAIRNFRGQQKDHCSMLVNASRFTRVQGNIRVLLHEKLEEILDAVRINGLKGQEGLKDPELFALYAIWEKEFQEVSPPWEEIQKNLLEAIATAKVVEVNSNVNELDYNVYGKQGQTVIAVGGFSLSRGVTLEGLTVTWFLRNSMMYDTLMQMGRWFGYRTDYEDLCRIWMPLETANWYSHISSSTDELHDELKTMERTRSTPEDFGLAVRSHPLALIVTARNKMGSGQTVKTAIRLSSQFVETGRISTNTVDLDFNLKVARKLVSQTQSENFVQEETKWGYLISRVPISIINEFLMNWRNAKQNLLTEPKIIQEYIKPRSGEELKEWDILIPSRKRGQEETALGLPIRPRERYVNVHDLNLGFMSFGSRLGIIGMEKSGVEIELAKRAENEFLLEHNKDDGKDIYFPGRIYRKVRKRPLFILHYVKATPMKDQKNEKDVELLPDDPVVGWGISFPASNQFDKPVEYVVNTMRYKELFGIDNDEISFEEEFYDD